MLFSPGSIICHEESSPFEEEKHSETLWKSTVHQEDIISWGKTSAVSCPYQSQGNKLPKALSFFGKVFVYSSGQQGAPHGKTRACLCFRVVDQAQVGVPSHSASECTAFGEWKDIDAEPWLLLLLNSMMWIFETLCPGRPRNPAALFQTHSDICLVFHLIFQYLLKRACCIVFWLWQEK